MPFAKNLSKFALMGLVTKYPHLRRLYIPISLDLQDLLFFQHYALAWLEHGPDRPNLKIFVQEIEVLPAIYKQFKTLLPESLRVHFVAFLQSPTFCDCRISKMTRSLIFWSTGAAENSSNRLEITNACPETKEEYFCQMIRPEVFDSASPDGADLVDLV